MDADGRRWTQMGNRAETSNPPASDTKHPTSNAQHPMTEEEARGGLGWRGYEEYTHFSADALICLD